MTRKDEVVAMDHAKQLGGVSSQDKPATTRIQQVPQPTNVPDSEKLFESHRENTMSYSYLLNNHYRGWMYGLMDIWIDGSPKNPNIQPTQQSNNPKKKSPAPKAVTGQ